MCTTVKKIENVVIYLDNDMPDYMSGVRRVGMVEVVYDDGWKIRFIVTTDSGLNFPVIPVFSYHPFRFKLSTF